MTYLVIYIVGALLMTVILTARGAIERKDLTEVGPWIAVAGWPLLIVALVIATPFTLAAGIGLGWRKRRHKLSERRPYSESENG